VNLEIKVQAPLWAQFDRIDVYASGFRAGRQGSSRLSVLADRRP
jgi:hypothetical protein